MVNNHLLRSNKFTSFGMAEKMMVNDYFWGEVKF